VHGQPVAIPTSEQAVWSANAAAAADRFTAIYPTRPGPSLDYPVVVLSKTVAATALLLKLGSPRARAAIERRGFRAFDGTPPAGLRHAAGITATAPASVGAPSRGQVAAVLAALAVVRRPSRMLAVIDVSGSMASAVPGLPGSSRITLARDAAREGLTLLPDDSEVGLWRFSADLPVGSDYEQLVPVAPLTAANRQRLATAVSGLTAVPEGGTGLYDTILAAVESMRASFDPSRVNSVVVLSDGRDEADATHRISETELLSALDAERRSTRPVKVVAIAYGPDSDATALRAISAASGGSAYTSADPRDLPRVLRSAIGQRLCQPSC
jgi:Mg-chelatase subunit ChlD